MLSISGYSLLFQFYCFHTHLESNPSWRIPGGHSKVLSQRTNPCRIWIVMSASNISNYRIWPEWQHMNKNTAIQSLNDSQLELKSTCRLSNRLEVPGSGNVCWGWLLIEDLPVTQLTMASKKSHDNPKYYVHVYIICVCVCIYIYIHTDYRPMET